jgi:hypothetical protein
MKFFTAKPPEAHVVLGFDFTPGLSGEETLTDIISIEVSVYAGEDDNPSDILSTTASPTVQDGFVFVPIVETKATYQFTVIVDTDNPSKRLQMCAVLPLGCGGAICS